ncbi:ATP-grasp domain-containing protein [Halomonas sp. RA08-2]|uniref:ATP-grasp domain-containing protein n=1 Tax=Halomonas sp. RA08-2 TaxID=3440842 RepID=UPI003EE8DCF6
MRVAIHHRPGSFSDRWIAYCEKKTIPYKLVNAFDSEIVEQLGDCNVLMWHHHHAIYKDVVAAKKILFALEHAGIKVFPDFKTGWHFDDKVAQKYLLEAIGAPLVPSYVFYDKQEALAWAKASSFPKVFKLKGGAGAANVRLVRSEADARKLIGKAFGKGFPQYDRFSALKERFRKFRNKQTSFLYVLKGVGRLLITPDFAKQHPNEKGYVYFQDFVPGNDSDTRVVIVAGKYAIAESRVVRSGDFKASGSGLYNYDRISKEVINLAFSVAEKLELQSVAFDFIQDKGRNLIVELSYGFGTEGILKAPGYWDKGLNWYVLDIAPQEWMVDAVINQYKL